MNSKKSNSKNIKNAIHIVSMTLEDIQTVKEIEMSNNLSVWTQMDYVNELSRNDSIALVLKKSQEIVGFIIARLIINEMSEDNSSEYLCEIFNLAIKKEYQGIKLGKILLERFLSHVRQENVKSIWLEVRKSNFKAINLYQSFGFERKFVRKEFYSLPLEDADVMCLKLTT